MMTDKRFLRLLALYSLYNAAVLFFSSLFELYFYTLGLSLPYIILTNVFLFSAPLPFLLLAKRFDTKKSIPLGFLSIALSASILFLIHSTIAPYVARLFLGLAIFFFWLPFNVEFYRARKEGNALLGAIYYSVNPLLSLLFPVVSGLFASMYGFQALFAVSGIIFLISAIIAYFLVERKEYHYDIVESMKALSGLRTLIFIEGFSIGTIASMTLSTMLILYAKSPLDFGGVLSAVTVFSIIASVVTAKLSDRYQERRLFLILSSIGLLLAVLALNVSETAAVFFLGFGAVNFFRVILQPLPLALAVDRSKDLVQTMAAREVMLGAGRVCAVLLGFVITAFLGIRMMLLMQTLAVALYVPVFEMKKRKIAGISPQRLP